jgi:hypothetical protein
LSTDQTTDLFGQPITKPVKSAPDYAHPAKPGTGPDGETCGTCAHCTKTGRRRIYYKCGKIRPNWTHGSETDLRLKDQACMFFKKVEV